MDTPGEYRLAISAFSSASSICALPHASYQVFHRIYRKCEFSHFHT